MESNSCTTCQSSSWSYIWSNRYWCIVMWPWINGFHGYEAYLWVSSLIGPCHPIVEGNALSIDNLNRLCIITRWDPKKMVKIEGIGADLVLQKPFLAPNLSSVTRQYPAWGVCHLGIRPMKLIDGTLYCALYWAIQEKIWGPTTITHEISIAIRITTVTRPTSLKASGQTFLMIIYSFIPSHR